MNGYAFALLFFLFKRRTNGTIESVVDPFRRIGFGLLLLIRGTDRSFPSVRIKYLECLERKVGERK